MQGHASISTQEQVKAPHGKVCIDLLALQGLARLAVLTDGLAGYAQHHLVYL